MLRNYLKSLLKRMMRFFRILLNIPIRHQVGIYSLKLPPDHLLMEYQSRFPKYDQFLPILASQCPSNSILVDIGANVGDTLLACASTNPGISFVCIEPDKDFFGYLKKNSLVLPSEKVDLFQSAISSSEIKVKLEGRNGTRSSAPSTDGLRTETLDSILSLSRKFSHMRVSLIKSDTDGHDWSTISSGLKVISKDKPIIFMECQVNDIHFRDNYIRLFECLEDIGYQHWTSFSNTGEIIKDSLDSHFAKKAIMSSKNNSYIDLCLSTPSDYRKVRNALDLYESRHGTVIKSQ